MIFLLIDWGNIRKLLYQDFDFPQFGVNVWKKSFSIEIVAGTLIYEIKCMLR
jgi:hypothetical protein